ncbi:MAG: choline dehydrogenase [Sphingomonadales bacterium]|jgi:choline dehydrogenase|nr:choline dehydrogenase [Sphingomonadales bacterium]
MFDYVIVGGGSAASVLAARLSESGEHKICVLEAGPPDRNPYIRMPAGFIKTLSDPKLTWQFDTEPSPHIGGRSIRLAQGRTLGGSSAINGGVYVRGQRADFDQWAQRGNRGWSYAELLPYFRRTEHRIGPGDDFYRGRAGALPVSTPRWDSDLCDAFIASAAANAIPANDDYNGAVQEGAGRYQSATLNGRRHSAAFAFLHPARRGGNVEVRTHAQAVRIRIEEGRARGVDYVRRDGSPATVDARLGIVVAAGALNSPKLLQLSGIGPADLLRSCGVPVVVDRPGVGGNLHDHFSPRLVYRVRGAATLNSRVKGLPLAVEALRWLLGRPSVLGLSPALAHGFGRSDPALDAPDFTLVFMPASYKAGRVGMLDDFPGMTCGVWQMRPESRGHVSIHSADWREAPAVDPAYLSAESDRRVLVKALKRARTIFRTAPLDGFADSEILPGEKVESDEAWLEFARDYGSTSYHLVGSCAMGPPGDRTAVVGPDLRVHGIDCLWVADSSIIPSIPSANTYAAVLMIGEKAADLILGRAPPPAAILPEPAGSARRVAAS